MCGNSKTDACAGEHRNLARQRKRFAPDDGNNGRRRRERDEKETRIIPVDRVFTCTGHAGRAPGKNT